MKDSKVFFGKKLTIEYFLNDKLKGTTNNSASTKPITTYPIYLRVVYFGMTLNIKSKLYVKEVTKEDFETAVSSSLIKKEQEIVFSLIESYGEDFDKTHFYTDFNNCAIKMSKLFINILAGYNQSVFGNMENELTEEQIYKIKIINLLVSFYFEFDDKQIHTGYDFFKLGVIDKFKEFLKIRANKDFLAELIETLDFMFLFTSTHYLGDNLNSFFKNLLKRDGKTPRPLIEMSKNSLSVIEKPDEIVITKN